MQDAIERRDCSRQDLARAIGVSPSELSQRLSGKRNLTLRSLACMADALDYDVQLGLIDRRASVTPLPRLTQRQGAWAGDRRNYNRTAPHLRAVSSDSNSGAA
ncbi:helix-turn-helix domain-containing protein [Mumia flava]|uniref:helix-turn-helix domain-containing protein n=1 Tax=Mumia flava TaxID=1348852 RepID=UPI003CCC4615